MSEEQKNEQEQHQEELEQQGLAEQGEVEQEQVVEVEEKKKSKWLIILLLLLLLLALIGLLFPKNGLQEKSRLERDIDAIKGVMPGRSIDEIQGLLNQVVERGMVNVAINPEPIFKNGKAKGNIGIENISGNHYALQVDLTLDKTGELLYSSGLIDPGYYIDEIKLQKVLPKGVYPVTASFSAYYLDDTSELLVRTNVEIKINILK